MKKPPRWGLGFAKRWLGLADIPGVNAVGPLNFRVAVFFEVLLDRTIGILGLVSVWAKLGSTIDNLAVDDLASPGPDAVAVNVDGLFLCARFFKSRSVKLDLMAKLINCIDA